MVVELTSFLYFLNGFLNVFFLGLPWSSIVFHGLAVASYDCISESLFFQINNLDDFNFNLAFASSILSRAVTRKQKKPY